MKIKGKTVLIAGGIGAAGIGLFFAYKKGMLNTILPDSMKADMGGAGHDMLDPGQTDPINGTVPAAIPAFPPIVRTPATSVNPSPIYLPANAQAPYFTNEIPPLSLIKRYDPLTLLRLFMLNPFNTLHEIIVPRPVLIPFRGSEDWDGSLRRRGLGIFGLHREDDDDRSHINFDRDGPGIRLNLEEKLRLGHEKEDHDKDDKRKHKKIKNRHEDDFKVIRIGKQSHGKKDDDDKSKQIIRIPGGGTIKFQ